MILVQNDVYNTPFTLSWVTHNGFFSKPRANSSSRLHMLNNNVQKQVRKYLLFSAYKSNAEVEATESSKAKNKAEEAVQ